MSSRASAENVHVSNENPHSEEFTALRFWRNDPSRPIEAGTYRHPRITYFATNRTNAEAESDRLSHLSLEDEAEETEEQAGQPTIVLEYEDDDEGNMAIDEEVERAESEALSGLEEDDNSAHLHGEDGDNDALLLRGEDEDIADEPSVQDETEGGDDLPHDEAEASPPGGHRLVAPEEGDDEGFIVLPRRRAQLGDVQWIEQLYDAYQTRRGLAYRNQNAYVEPVPESLRDIMLYLEVKAGRFLAPNALSPQRVEEFRFAFDFHLRNAVAYIPELRRFVSLRKLTFDTAQTYRMRPSGRKAPWIRDEEAISMWDFYEEIRQHLQQPQWPLVVTSHGVFPAENVMFAHKCGPSTAEELKLLNAQRHALKVEADQDLATKNREMQEHERRMQFQSLRDDYDSEREKLEQELNMNLGDVQERILRLNALSKCMEKYDETGDPYSRSDRRPPTRGRGYWRARGSVPYQRNSAPRRGAASPRGPQESRTAPQREDASLYRSAPQSEDASTSGAPQQAPARPNSARVERSSDQRTGHGQQCSCYQCRQYRLPKYRRH